MNFGGHFTSVTGNGFIICVSKLQRVYPTMSITTVGRHTCAIISTVVLCDAERDQLAIAKLLVRLAYKVVNAILLENS